MPYQGEGISAPWLGWKDDLPAMLSPSNSFKQITNAIITKGRLYAFPTFSSSRSLLPPDGNQIMLIKSFLDILGNWHTAFVTTQNIYYSNGDSTFNLLGALPNVLQTSFPLTSQVLLNKLWFGGPYNLSLTWLDGSATVFTGLTDGFWYSGKLANRLIIANTIEPQNTVAGSLNFPYRVRWSKNGDPSNWTDISSGANDLAETEDGITGFVTLDQVGYIFRTFGITTMTPTGNFQLPFVFDNFSTSEEGLGNSIPGSLASFGVMACFVGPDDIYSMFPASYPNRIGGAAKKSIFKDLSSAIGPVTAAIIPSLVPGIDYLSYWLGIPVANNTTSIWIYHFDDNTWVNEQLPFGALQFIRSIIWQ